MDTPLAANIINALVALATFTAVIVGAIAIWYNRKQAKEDWQHNRQLALEERQHQSRPIVVPVGELSHHTPDGSVDWEHLRQIVPPPPPGPPGTSVAGTEPITQTIMLQNMGEGVAFNVHCILYGPHTVAADQYVSWNNGPIQGKDHLQIVCGHGGMVLEAHDKVDGVHVLYDSSEPNYRIARLTITYHDLFDRKHVSIFDYIHHFMPPREHRWMHVATKSGIEYDLEELDNQGQHQSVKRKPIK